MEHIETIELDSSQASIEFSSIPQDYDDLKILVSARSDRTGKDGDNVNIQLNSESSSTLVLKGNGSSDSSSTETDGRIGVLGTNETPANTFNSVSVYISNYTSTSNKSVSGDGVFENNATRADQSLMALLSTSSAATTSITLTVQSGKNFTSGSTASLYGVTAGGSGTVTAS